MAQLSSALYLGAAGLLASSLYVACLAIYRLYLSPIAKFPGPKLAGLTLWYEFYHDVIRGGQYLWKVNELHDQYGTRTSASFSELTSKICQDQSSESTLMNSTSETQTSTTCYTAARDRSVTNGGGRSRCLERAPPVSRPFPMTSIASGEVL